jgi:hypothetical protein
MRLLAVLPISQEPTLASHLAESKQDACAYKILQDGRFDKIEQEHLARSIQVLSRSFKYYQDLSSTI